MNTTLRSFVLGAALLGVACSPMALESPFPDDAYTISATRLITDVERGAFAFDALGVTVSNDFAGGRFSEATIEGDSVLVLRIGPENAHGLVSRDWAWREYQAPGMVYEVGDNTPRPLIREVAETAARGTMEILLERAMQEDGG